MPDTKISELPSASALIGTEFIPVVQENQTVKTTFAAVQNTVVAAITPSIALKAPIASPTFTGSVTAPTFVGALTGTATSATALAAGADRTKLDGIAAAATANSSDATLLARANHTGTQLVTTISNLGTGTVTATGASAARSLAAYSADRINVKNFGALGDGTTDDSVAVLAAFTAGRLLSFGAHIYFPTGKYNLASMTASSCLRVFSGARISGDGYPNTILKWNDDDGVVLFRGPSSGRVTDCVLEDFAIQGTQDTRGNNVGSGSYPILLSGCDNVHIRRLLVEKSRVFAMAIRSSKNVTVQDCVIRLCGRDGINIAQATRYVITGNQISNCDDDGIAAHTDSGGQESTPNGGVISGNTLFDCQGIKVLGARHCVISDNTLDCVKAQGISVWPVTHTGTATEGVAAMLDVVISNNKISNVLDRTAIDGLNANNNYINIGGHSAQAGTLAAVPGEPDTATGTIVPYYDYVNNNGAATTVPTPGSNGVIITGNIFSRTLKGGVAFSTYGRGLIFSRGGWYDPVFTTTQVGQSNGIVIASGVLKNLQISDNIFTGLSTGIGINNHDRIDNLVVKDNLFWDILNYGYIINPGVTGKILRSYVEQNIFDMDPLHVSPNRGANGTWLANSQPTAVQFQSGDGGVIVRGNTFRNVCRDSSQDTSALSTLARFENNYIEADPTTMGSFSTSNKGVGIIRRDAGVTLIQVDSDPASTNYGRILTPGGVATNAMPSTGKYLAGAFIRNTAAATSAGKIIQGWHRLTTGTGHVLGTDWLEMSYVTDINAVLATATGASTARTLAAHLGDVFNVKGFGATGLGVADDTVAINAAIVAANAAGGGTVYFPHGIYLKLGSTTAITPKSNVTLRGDGQGISVIQYDTTSSTNRCIYNPASYALTNFRMTGLSVLGGWLANQTNGTQQVEIIGGTNIRIEDCEFGYSRAMGLVITQSTGVVVNNCYVHHTNGDGIAVWYCPDAVITNNRCLYCDDDSISAHTLDAQAAPSRSGMIIANNHIRSGQGISALGAKSLTITGNVMERVLSYGIYCSSSTFFNQGNTPIHSIKITNNVINDVMLREHGGNGEQYYIRIGGGGLRNAGGAAAPPGLNDAATGTIIDLYGTLLGNFQAQNTDDTTVASPGGYFIDITGNTLTRTLPAVSAYSDWGFGPLFAGNQTGAGITSGYYNGPISEASLQTLGIELEPNMRNVHIKNNIISTSGSKGIFFKVGATPEDLSFDNLTIDGNTFFNFKDYGVFWEGSTLSRQNIRVTNNLFDGDLLHNHANRGANGTWLANSFPVAVYFASAGGVTVQGNDIANVCIPISSGATANNIILDNKIRCEPAVIGFSTSNKGVGVLPRAGASYRIIHEGSDPASTDYGKILSPVLYDSTTIPTTGSYVAGHFVHNSNPSVSASKVMIGWARLTTGSAHVSGTDWSPLYCTVS